MNVSRLFLFFLIYWTDKILHCNSITTCTINPQFSQVTKTTGYTLCDKDGCNINFLTYDHVYTGCKVNDGGVRPVLFLVLNTARQRVDEIYCLGDFWVDSTKCVTSNLKKFTRITTKVPPFSTFGIRCGDSPAVQFPSISQEFVQLQGYDYHRFENDTLVFLPTLTLKCVAYCLESKSEWVHIGAKDPNYVEMIDSTDTRIARISYQPRAKLPDYRFQYHCKAPQAFELSITFYIISSVTSYINNDMVKGEFKRDGYDAGEKLHCYLNAFYNNYPYTKAVIKVKIQMLATDGSYASPLEEEYLTINENMIITKDYVFTCSLGNTSMKASPKNIKNNYFMELQKYPFHIKAKFKTQITYTTGRGINAFDINENAMISCNMTYYEHFYKDYDPNIQIHIIYNKEIIYPLSSLISHKNTVKVSSTKNEIKFVRKPDTNTLLYCTIDDFFSTPELTNSGSRPILLILNEFPKWDTGYTIKGFVYLCLSNFTTYIEFNCMNCTPEVKYRKEIADRSIYLFFEEEIAGDVVVEFRCIGYSKAYESKFQSLVLRLISVVQTKYNETNAFFMRMDLFNCIATFTTFDNKVRKVVEIPLPTFLNVDNITYVTTSTNKLLKLETSAKYPVFEACCSQYIKHKESCVLKSLKVVESYTIFWNRDLKSIYPGNEISCGMCFNFTDSAKVNPCSGSHTKISKIGMITTFPDSSIEDIKCEAGNYAVRSPLQFSPPNSSESYEMSDQTTYVTCCIKRNPVTIKLGLKSCNEYPPDIKIIPPYRTRFIVGDSFSCTTDNVDCQQGINYKITAKVGTRNLIVRTSSYKLTYEDIGNRVTIICAAGTKKLVNDSRLVRVEQKPFNVSIKGLFRILWPGTYLSCLAQGFPRPTITWIQTGGLSPLRVSENFLLIGPWDITGIFSVTCQAKNKVGHVKVHATFRIFNPEITLNDFSWKFYILIPGLTIFFLCLMMLSVLLTLQEDIFGVPFFSPNRAVKDANKKSKLAQLFGFEEEKLP